MLVYEENAVLIKERMFNETGWLKQNQTSTEAADFTSATSVLLVLTAPSCQHTPGTISDTSAILVFHINPAELLCVAHSDMEQRPDFWPAVQDTVSLATSYSIQLICL